MPFFWRLRLEGGKDGIIWQNKKCGERRGDFSICHRGYFNHLSFFHLWALPVGCRTNRGGIYPHCFIWILTLKRIYAEGLQQGRRKEEIINWRMNK